MLLLLWRARHQELGGDYHVALNRDHLEELMMRSACPPASLAKETPSSLVNMVSAYDRAGGGQKSLLNQF